MLAGLRGIGSNLLATRLREMVEAGLVERGVLPPPAGSSVYQLTATGQALEPVISAIGGWGARFLVSPRASDLLSPRARLVAIRSGFHPQYAADLVETYELRIGVLVFEVHVEHGRCATREGSAVDPDAVMVMDVTTLNALLMEGRSARSALAEGLVEITGDPTSLDRFVDMFAADRSPAAAGERDDRR